tara:strand:- start:924 stop:1073 length:150 start_codon:yes stop_codon:yes gene_type:complete
VNRSKYKSQLLRGDNAPRISQSSLRYGQVNPYWIERRKQRELNRKKIKA